MTNQPLSRRDQLIMENYESTKKQLADCLVSYTEAVMCEDEHKMRESFNELQYLHGNRMRAIHSYRWLEKTP